MSQKCLICNAPEAESHFGGISCRACAAFFRRFFNSPKRNSLFCKCGIKTLTHAGGSIKNSHPCRSCRIQKCFEAGMVKEKVQGMRDRHSAKIEENLPNLSPVRLIASDTPHISFATANWSFFETKRREIHGGNFGIHMNIYQLTSFAKQDLELIWELVSFAFPEIADLEASDKTALLTNFVPKWWQINPVLDHIEHPEVCENMAEEQYEEALLECYQGAFFKDKEMTREWILRTFEPIWWFYYTKMIVPIGNLNMDESEIIAFIWLSFFDHAYTNLSPVCSEMCRNIKKVILKELRNHQVENEKNSHFFDIISSLSIIERAEEKFQEEMLICEMNNVQLHEDFKNIMSVNKV